jgi:hypothetical protein
MRQAMLSQSFGAAGTLKPQRENCDPGAGQLSAIIKPTIVRHTNILSANYLFLLTPPTYPIDRLANPAAKTLSIRSSRSLPGTFRVIFFFGVEPFDSFSDDIAA